MTGIILAFPKMEEGKSIRNILIRNGFSNVFVCTTGLQAMQHADDLRQGIVVSGYKLTDMIYHELEHNLPADFEMLLIASAQLLSRRSESAVVSLGMPLKVHELISTLHMMQDTIERKRRKKKLAKPSRTKEEEEILQKAKQVLMERNGFTELEAHKYIQKCSMDSGNNLVETAQMVLSMF